MFTSRLRSILSLCLMMLALAGALAPDQNPDMNVSTDTSYTQPTPDILDNEPVPARFDWDGAALFLRHAPVPAPTPQYTNPYHATLLRPPCA